MKKNSSGANTVVHFKQAAKVGVRGLRNCYRWPRGIGAPLTASSRCNRSYNAAYSLLVPNIKVPATFLQLEDVAGGIKRHYLVTATTRAITCTATSSLATGEAATVPAEAQGRTGPGPPQQREDQEPPGQSDNRQVVADDVSGLHDRNHGNQVEEHLKPGDALQSRCGRGRHWRYPPRAADSPSSSGEQFRDLGRVQGGTLAQVVAAHEQLKLPRVVQRDPHPPHVRIVPTTSAGVGNSPAGSSITTTPGEDLSVSCAAATDVGAETGRAPPTSGS